MAVPFLWNHSAFTSIFMADAFYIACFSQLTSSENDFPANLAATLLI